MVFELVSRYFLSVSVVRRASKSCFFSQISFSPLKRRAIFTRPACPGLAHISANQFKSAFISVEILVVATLRCASVVDFGFWLLLCGIRGIQ
jgi:hypothetical protein